MKIQASDNSRSQEDAEGTEPFALTDEMLASVVGGATASPSPTQSPLKPEPVSVHNWDGNWWHI